MLVLHRHLKQGITIDGVIKIVVLKCSQSGAVRLGIEAPPHVRIVRSELAEHVTTNEESQAHGNA